MPPIVSMVQMPHIRVRPETLRALNYIKGFLMSQEGERVSHDDVINFLMLTSTIKPEQFPHWPIFEPGKRRALERALKEFNQLLVAAFESARKSRHGA